MVVIDLLFYVVVIVVELEGLLWVLMLNLLNLVLLDDFDLELLCMV